MASVTLQIQKTAPVSFQEVVLAMLSSALCTAGCAALLIPVFPHIAGTWPVYAAAGSILAAVFCCLLYLRFGKMTVLLVSASVFVLFLFRFSVIRNGLFLLANDLLEFLTGKSGQIHLYYQTDGNSGCLLVPVLYLILTALISAVMIRRKRLYFPVILLVLSVIARIAGLPSSPASVLILTAASVISLIPCSRTNASIRSRRSGILWIFLPLLPALAASAGLLLLVRTVTGTDGSQTGSAMRKASALVHSFRYEPSGRTGMPEGDLKSYTPSEDEDTALLLISMSDPGKLYLRGFTADIYEDSVWKGLRSDEYIDNAARFYTLHKNGFYGQTMLASAAQSLLNADENDMTVLNIDPAQTEEIRITNVNGCRKYHYLPYALADASVPDPMQIGDSGTPARNIGLRASADPDTVTVPYLPGSLPEWYDIETALAENVDSHGVSGYLRMEQAYCDYAMSCDRQVSEEAAAVCADLFGAEPVGRHLSEILALVHKTLDSGFTYEENLETPDGTDVFASFMEQKKGSSVHYATAAAVMLRYLGVPSRYVEGFLLKADEAGSYSPGEEIVLTEKHAHAWAEFYLRGIGWIPFESSPGYIDNDELSQITTLAESALSSSGNSPLYTQTEIVYTSGVHEDASASRRSQPVRFTWHKEYLLIPLSAAVSYFLASALIVLALRRRRLSEAKRKMQQAKDEGNYAEAIALQFGYASMLMKEAGIKETPGLEDMRKLNEEARFSDHAFTEKQVRQAEHFTNSVIRSCSRTWSARELLRNHFIRWIL